MATNIIIGNQSWIPGQLLSLTQMIAIQTSVNLGTGQYEGASANSLAGQAYAQFLAQGGQHLAI
jgi:hypothetical protein